jgi:hypothetical protein
MPETCVEHNPIDKMAKPPVKAKSGLQGYVFLVHFAAVLFLISRVIENMREPSDSAWRDCLVNVFQNGGLWACAALVARTVLRRMPFKRQVDSEFVTFFVGAFHAAWACCYGFYHNKPAFPFGAEDLLKTLDGPTPEASVFLFQVMAGYFVYDSVLGLYAERIEQGKPIAKLSWATLIIHHGACMFILPAMAVNGRGGQWAGIAIPFFEWTTPLVNISWMLRYHKLEKMFAITTIILKVAFAILFTVGRTGVVNYIYLNVTQSTVIPFWLKVLCGGLPLVSMFWQYKIIFFVKKAVCAKPKATKEE